MMDIIKTVGELRWLPAGTCKNDPTMPSDLVYQRLNAKAFVHKRTSIKAKEGFLILEVKDEEAIVGRIQGEKSLGELFEKRSPLSASLSCADLLRLYHDDDPTEADKALLRGLKTAQLTMEGESEKDEGLVFFRDLCSYINERNLYTIDSSNDNTSLSK